MRHRSQKQHTTKLNNDKLSEQNDIAFGTGSHPQSNVITLRFTLPEQTPYDARAPAQQKQKPGGFVRADAE